MAGDLPAISDEPENGILTESKVPSNPLILFASWLQQAIEHNTPNANAMALATSTKSGRPSVRIVLMKNWSTEGFVFCSNYESRKGQELEHNPQAALLFFWPQLKRQVRIEGLINKLPDSESDHCFTKRPYGNQVSAWASRQSQVIDSRDVLESNFRKIQQHFRENPIPRPPYWGGYLLVPLRIEFWQERENRLHDRLLYDHNGENWEIKRLAP